MAADVLFAAGLLGLVAGAALIGGVGVGVVALGCALLVASLTLARGEA